MPFNHNWVIMVMALNHDGAMFRLSIDAMFMRRTDAKAGIADGAAKASGGRRRGIDDGSREDCCDYGDVAHGSFL